MNSFHYRKEILNQRNNASINDGIQEDVSKIERSVRKRSHTDDDHKVKEPPQKVQKYSNNPDVQVGTVRTLRNRTYAVPAVQGLSKTLTSDSSKVQRAVKKPKGKGFSKGAYGDKTVIVTSSKSSESHSIDDIPDLVDENGLPAPAPKKRKTVGRQTKNTKRVANQR